MEGKREEEGKEWQEERSVWLILGTTYENSQRATVRLQSRQCWGPLMADQMSPFQWTLQDAGHVSLTSRNTQTCCLFVFFNMNIYFKIVWCYWCKHRQVCNNNKKSYSWCSPASNVSEVKGSSPSLAHWTPMLLLSWIPMTPSSGHPCKKKKKPI